MTALRLRSDLFSSAARPSTRPIPSLGKAQASLTTMADQLRPANTSIAGKRNHSASGTPISEKAANPDEPTLPAFLRQTKLGKIPRDWMRDLA